MPLPIRTWWPIAYSLSVKAYGGGGLGWRPVYILFSIFGQGTLPSQSLSFTKEYITFTK